MTAQADTSAIRTLIEKANESLRARDVQALVASYASDAVIFDLAPPLAHQMNAGDITAWLDTWDGPVTRTVRDLEITVEGNLAFAHCFVQTRAVTKNTKEQAQWWARATLCFKRSENRWSVVHEHVSVPFYMDGSFRAALDLQP
jgi:ketosteroid isomerase-like protein